MIPHCHRGKQTDFYSESNIYNIAFSFLFHFSFRRHANMFFTGTSFPWPVIDITLVLMFTWEKTFYRHDQPDIHVCTCALCIKLETIISSLCLNSSKFYHKCKWAVIVTFTCGSELYMYVLNTMFYDRPNKFKITFCNPINLSFLLPTENGAFFICFCT